MPSFKLWILSALALSAIAFSPSTVFAEEVPAKKWIVGSWKITLVLHPKIEPGLYGSEILIKEAGRISVEIRADGTITAQYDGEPKRKDEATWKLVDKGEKKLELELTNESGKKTACDFAWINKDEFTVEVPSIKSDTFGLVTGFRFHRKKVAPKP